MRNLTSLREKLLKKTKEQLRHSVKKDQMIVQSISLVFELERSINLLSKRLREWYSWHLPEFEHSIESHEKFAELLVKKDKPQLMKELNLKESMGADLGEKDVEQIRLLAREILQLSKLRAENEEYITKIMRDFAPNLLKIAGALIGAKLIALAGSLERLAELPSSTVQLLGAEKALFRHMTKKSKCPKYGIIINHPDVQKADKQSKGKAARNLANKISIAARVDFFRKK